MKRVIIFASGMTLAGLALFEGASAGPQNNSNHSAPAPTASQETVKIDPTKEADIRKLLEVTDAQALAQQSMSQMEQSMKPLLTTAFPPGEYREQLIQLFFTKFHSKADGKEIVELAIPVYDKYFSDDEIKGLMQFYGTPLGKKTLNVLPKLMAELQARGRQWGENVGRQTMTEVLAEHPELVEQIRKAKSSTP